ncbi:hypothetical protein PQX77_014797 [Marasmius sp. AFHP31]|nr:hypothetical protein PQX77_014797 [Marasmius sp. AFHP31]
MPSDTHETTRTCSTKKCNAALPSRDIDPSKTCVKCRTADRERKRRSRAKKRERDEEEHPPSRLDAPPNPGEALLDGEESESDTETERKAKRFKDAEDLLQELRQNFSEHPDVDFRGEFTLPTDPLVSDKERVKMMIHEVWKVTGYRFTVKKNPHMVTGHKTVLHCSQDVDKKRKSRPQQQKSGEKEIQHRQTVGMTRYPCRSKLIVTCKNPNMCSTGMKLVTIDIHHHKRHIPYYDVGMPEEAAQVIRENLLDSTPNSLVHRLQKVFPQLTAKQVHSAWTVMSEEVWKKDKMQIPSAKTLIEEYSEIVEAFDVQHEEGVEQLCWGMKIIAATINQLGVRVEEMSMDATCEYSFRIMAEESNTWFLDETNAHHLELYCIMAEVDGAGFPLSYCLLSTVESVEVRKRTRALEKWATCVRERYGIMPDFIHVDKDMAKIGMAREVWPVAKIQICWWHQRKALRERIMKAKLSTTPYDPIRAHNKFAFIDTHFFPPGRPDPGEREGGREGGGRDRTLEDPHDEKNPHGVYITLPATQKASLEQIPINDDTINSKVPTAALTIKLPPLASIKTEPGVKRHSRCITKSN